MHQGQELRVRGRGGAGDEDSGLWAVRAGDTEPGRRTARRQWTHWVVDVAGGKAVGGRKRGQGCSAGRWPLAA